MLGRLPAEKGAPRSATPLGDPRDQGCDLVQGWLYGKPRPIGEICAELDSETSIYT